MTIKILNQPGQAFMDFVRCYHSPHPIEIFNNAEFLMFTFSMSDKRKDLIVAVLEGAGVKVWELPDSSFSLLQLSLQTLLANRTNSVLAPLHALVIYDCEGTEYFYKNTGTQKLPKIPSREEL